jgi:hypothetical protein
MQFSPPSVYIFHPRHKYSPEHSVLKLPQSMLFPQHERRSFTLKTVCRNRSSDIRFIIHVDPNIRGRCKTPERHGAFQCKSVNRIGYVSTVPLIWLISFHSSTQLADHKITTNISALKWALIQWWTLHLGEQCATIRLKLEEYKERSF